MNQWQRDKKWADKFLPEIKSILGRYLIGEAPREEDAEHNTDLIVLKMDAVRIGCRMRKYDYLIMYGDEFTIRSGRPSGMKTELTKIIEGWGDYFFYGFSDADETQIARWTLADMKVFRLWYNRKLARAKSMSFPGIKKDNSDGSSSFVAFRWADFPDDFIVSRN